MQISVPSITVQASGLSSPAGCLEASAENRDLVLSATRATGPPTLDPQAPSSHPSAVPNEEQLYTVSIKSGGAHAGFGPANSSAAGTVTISGVSADLHLNRASPTMSQASVESVPAAAVVHAHVEITAVASQCCPAALWPLVSVFQQLLQQQHQEQLLRQQGGLLSIPTEGPTQQDRSTQLRQRRHTGEDASQGQSVAARQSSEAAAAGQAAVGEASPAAGPEPAPAVVPASEPCIGFQWEMCIQASSNSQVEVVNAGSVLFSCGVDMVTIRAASGNGSSMVAASVADTVVQLSVQVSYQQADW